MKRVCDNISELYFATAAKDPRISLNKFNQAINTGYGTASTWVNRRGDPQCALIPRIAKFFGVPIARLFEGVE